MEMPVWTRLLLYVVEYSATAIFTFTIFRLLAGRTDNKLKVLAMATIMSIISFYLSDIAEMTEVKILFIPMSMIVMTTVWFSLPIFYSFLLATIFTAIGFIGEFVIASAAQLLGVTSYSEIGASTLQITLMQMAMSVVFVLLSYYFSIRKFGFMVLSKEMYGAKAFTPFNLLLAILLILIICVFQASKLTAYSASHHWIHPIVFFGIAGSLFITLLAAWYQNKRAVRNKYSNTGGIGKKHA